MYTLHVAVVDEGLCEGGGTGGCAFRSVRCAEIPITVHANATFTSLQVFALDLLLIRIVCGLVRTRAWESIKLVCTGNIQVNFGGRNLIAILTALAH